MITERDIKILRELVRLRFLNTFQLEILMPYDGRSQKSKGATVRRRMNDLELEEKLIKSFRPDMKSPKVYYLSEKGVQWCCSYFGLDEFKPPRRTAQLTHQLRIADFYCALYELNKDGFKLDKFITDWSIQIEGSTLKPDIFFRLVSKKQYLGFVEIDLGSYALTKLVSTKLPRYEGLFQDGVYVEKYGVFPTIYFITNSEERAENLRLRLAKEKTTDLPYKVVTYEALNNIEKLLDIKEGEHVGFMGIKR